MLVFSRRIGTFPSLSVSTGSLCVKAARLSGLCRKEKEAAAAKQAKEEEQRRRQEELQQLLREAKERYHFECYFKQPQQGFSGPAHQALSGPAHQGPWYNSRGGYGRQGKSATWHAQEPPSLQRWDSGSFHGRDGWSGNNGGSRWDCRGGFHGNQQGRLPWLSNGGSSYGVYGRNNIQAQRGRPQSLLGRPPQHTFFDQADPVQPPSSRASQRHTPEPEPSTQSSKTPGGSNPKPDKACRWTPYPPAKNPEPAPQKDGSSSEKASSGPKKQDKVDSGAPKRPGPKPGLEEKGTPKVQQREDEVQTSASNKLLKLKDLKKAPQKVSKAPAPTLQALTAPAKPSGVTPLLPRKEPQLPERPGKAKTSSVEKRASLESCRSSRPEAAPQEPPQRELGQSRPGVSTSGCHRLLRSS